MFAKWIQEDGRFAFSTNDNGGMVITEEVHAALVMGESAGQVIEVDVSGMPVLGDARALSVEGRIAALLSRVDARLNEGAKAKGYDSIITAALRAGYPGPFHAEGVKYATWMDATYARCYEILAQWKAGSIAEPSAAALLAMLPVLELG